MCRSVFRLPIIVSLCLALSMAGGCSALRFGYNQAADLAYWWLDGFVDFNDAQTVLVRDGLASWFAWHRATQLPDYARLLVRAQGEVLQDTTPERACGWWDTLDARMVTGLERAVPTGVELMLSITPRQIQHLERRYAKANAEFRDAFLQADPTKRRTASLKRATERAEWLYGSLEDAQRELLAGAVARSPFDPDVWFAERRHRQLDALDILRRLSAEGTTQDKAEAALRAYIDRWSRSPRAEYRRYSEELERFNCLSASTLHNATTLAQRQTAVLKLKAWEGDMRALAGDGVK